MSLLLAGGWARWPLKVPSNPNHFKKKTQVLQESVEESVRWPIRRVTTSSVRKATHCIWTKNNIFVRSICPLASAGQVCLIRAVVLLLQGQKGCRHFHGRTKVAGESPCRLEHLTIDTTSITLIRLLLPALATGLAIQRGYWAGLCVVAH